MGGFFFFFFFSLMGSQLQGAEAVGRTRHSLNNVIVIAIIPITLCALDEWESTYWTKFCYPWTKNKEGV